MKRVAVLLVLLAACTSSKTTAAPPSPTTTAPPVSSGCTAPPVAAGETKVTMTSSGVERYYYLHVPPAYDGKTPIPVVLDLHGWGEGADLHKVTTQLGPFGDVHGFVTVTPQGQGPVAHWETDAGSADHVFIGELLDRVEASICVDQRRIFIAGFSDGAIFASFLACELDDRVAAVAPVDGVYSVPDCAPDRPMPVIAFHGTADPYISYEGGLGQKALDLPTPDGSGTLGGAGVTGEDFPSVPETMGNWARLNQCADTAPAEEHVAADVTLLRFECPADKAVELYRVDGGGHSWPGSAFSALIANYVGPTTMSVDANELIWAFFEAHPMPA
jgi:polyhydroxybutyrate depolymerase